MIRLQVQVGGRTIPLDAGPAPAATISISTLVPLRRPRAPVPTLAFAPQAHPALSQMVLLLTVLVAFAVVQRAHQRQVFFVTAHTASARPLPF